MSKPTFAEHTQQVCNCFIFKLGYKLTEPFTMAIASECEWTQSVLLVGVIGDKMNYFFHYQYSWMDLRHIYQYT